MPGKATARPARDAWRSSIRCHLSLVSLKLDFERPFRANNSDDFTLTPSGGTTAVSWAMRGSRPFIAKLMGLFMNFDTLIGRDFEVGLANLKRSTEA